MEGIKRNGVKKQIKGIETAKANKGERRPVKAMGCVSQDQ